MLEQEKPDGTTMITQEEYDEAVNSELKLRKQKKGEDSGKEKIQGWFEDQLYYDVIDGLVEKYGYDREDANEMLFSGGLRVYATIDTDIQRTMEKVMKNDELFPEWMQPVKKNEEGGYYYPDPAGEEDYPHLESAMIIMDYEGRVLGTVGGRKKKASLQNSRVTTEPRQPGSAMKPISAYAPAIEYNAYYYSSYIADQPLTDENGETMMVNDQPWPQNWYLSYGRDPQLLWNELQWSYNTIPAWIVKQLDIQTCFDFLVNRFHMSTLVDDANGDLTYSTLSVGACAKGVLPRDMAAAYATFGSLGKYNRPLTYEKVTQVVGNNEVVILEKPKPEIAVSEDTAVIMNDLLQNVVKSGTGENAQFGGMPIYAKTGTTDESTDLYFCGGTPYYIGATWFGFDSWWGMENPNGTEAMNIWKAVMMDIHEGYEVKDFPESDKVARRNFCTASGDLARTGCPEKRMGVYKLDFIPGGCVHHGGEILPADDAGEVGSAGVSGGQQWIPPQTTKKNKKTTVPPSQGTIEIPTEDNLDPSVD